MIKLHPNRIYKIQYPENNPHQHGTTVYFQTLDEVPEAKHLIKVKDCRSGAIMELMLLLSHPWVHLREHTGEEPIPIGNC